MCVFAGLPHSPQRIKSPLIAYRPTEDDPIFRGFSSVEKLFKLVYNSPENPTFGRLFVQNADGSETHFAYDTTLLTEENQARFLALLPAY